MPLKKVALINAISANGKSSALASVPILATAQIETTVIPTAVFSDSTGEYYRDMTECILPIAEHIYGTQTEFDAISIGYLTDDDQIPSIIKTCNLLANTDTKIIIDPIMGDNGKLYGRFSCNFPAAMLELCKKADVILPNITEACLLTGIAYKEKYDESYILELATALYELTGCKIAITGVSFDERKIGVAVYRNDTLKYVFCDKVPAHYRGSGDIFSAAFIASVVNGRSTRSAAEIAQNFICGSIKHSFENNISENEGIEFESQLPNLVKYLDI